jgi:hypothetical protein
VAPVAALVRVQEPGVAQGDGQGPRRAEPAPAGECLVGVAERALRVPLPPGDVRELLVQLRLRGRVGLGAGVGRERRRVPQLGVLPGVQPRGLVAGAHHVPPRPRGVAGGAPVERQRVGGERLRRRRQRLQRPRHGAVDDPAAACQQVVVQRLLHEDVAEREAVLPARPLLDQHVLLDQALDDAQQLGLGDAGDLLEQVEVETPADDGRGVQHLEGALAERRETRQHGLADRGREVAAAQVEHPVAVHEPARVGQPPHQLLDEERVAAGAPGDLADERRRRRPAGEGGDEPRDLGLGERCEHDGAGVPFGGEQGDHAP